MTLVWKNGVEYGKNFSMECNMEWKIFNIEWKMEEILQYGIWKNRLPFHSIACPGVKNKSVSSFVVPFGTTFSGISPSRICRHVTRKF